MSDAATREIEDDRLGRRIVARAADQLDQPSCGAAASATRDADPPAAIAPSAIRPIGDPMTTITG